VDEGKEQRCGMSVFFVGAEHNDSESGGNSCFLYCIQSQVEILNKKKSMQFSFIKCQLEMVSFVISLISPLF
jgi:hypothetical protein